uniref:ACB domain-containing protein n=1 Tax=Rhabditophanes sp. KR3021 TaxID=114890 RepID=A0AC35U278_9BILA
MFRSVLRTNLLLTSRFSSSVDKFAAAQADLKRLSEEPDSDVKLKLYALYKQAKDGNTTTSRPSAINFVARAKFDAHKELENMSKEDAMTKYTDLVNEMLKNEAPTSPTTPSTSVPGLDISKEGKIFKITLNRPKKYNALTLEMYEKIGDALNESLADKTTTITVITGTGSYFCSGNDMSNFASLKTKEQIKEVSTSAGAIFDKFVKAFINHDKPLIGMINGPAVGISVTTLALYDYVIASDKATFHTPFADIGLTAEGCASYTFPQIMGSVKAAEVLMFSKKMTAQEACDRNLINQVVPDHSFKAESEKKIQQLSMLYPETLRLNKKLLRDNHRDALLAIHEKENALLITRFTSNEGMSAIAKFLSRKQ